LESRVSSIVDTTHEEVSLSTGEALWWSFIGANALLLPIAALMWAAKGYIEALGGDGPQGPWGFR
jgi:hypothetical protein